MRWVPVAPLHPRVPALPGHSGGGEGKEEEAGMPLSGAPQHEEGRPLQRGHMSVCKVH